MSTVHREATGLRVALSAVRSAPIADDSALDEVYARALLGSVAEPGDGLLGRAIDAIGAIGAAEHLLDSASPVGFADALTRAGGAIDAREAEGGLARWSPRLDQAAFARALEQAARVGARLLLPSDPAWPVGVDELGIHAPLGLWVRGREHALDGSSASISLVGARAATGYGEHVTMEASAGLVDRGFTIVSGGAYGIDGMAHRSALASDGTTVAFLAGGVDRFYPMGHETLLARIVATGAVVSELPCGAAPTKWRFLQRNRLIAAASEGTVVLEAGFRSGSLNTAGHAAALGRPLGAVPGPVTSPASAGCHRLLREYDAVCVTDAEQMAELVGGARRRAPSDGRTSDPASDDRGTFGMSTSPDAVRVLDALSTRSPRELADVARRCGMSPSAAMGVLGGLEAVGGAKRHPLGWLRVGRG
ncbi:DNA-processing protein DprA [Agromyces cerinus]|uniref:DNA protecting protein DprA n=1 Tax=Agromyces cerinus subsp. cerinus TaxID=232089 RepID=A0A1N6DMR4_9MICO|nr:DNA-processing protein DprA [Agromyces cerinus]SIN72050.1 DNA protecting protein DprA [Agromyces cerinus subsp. cerinus]